MSISDAPRETAGVHPSGKGRGAAWHFLAAVIFQPSSDILPDCTLRIQLEMLSRPQINRVKRLFLYPSHTSMKITASSDLPTGWHLLYPQSQNDLEKKNVLWKSLRLVQIIFTELCQGVMKWAIILLHQRVRFHQVRALVNVLLPLKQVSSLPPEQLSLPPPHANSTVPLTIG